MSEDIVIAISQKKQEPEWMTQWRLEAFRSLEGNGRTRMGQCKVPESPIFKIFPIILHPNKKPKYNSLDEVDPELLETFKKLGISRLTSKKNWPEWLWIL